MFDCIEKRYVSILKRVVLFWRGGVGISDKYQKIKQLEEIRKVKIIQKKNIDYYMGHL